MRTPRRNLVRGKRPEGVAFEYEVLQWLALLQHVQRSMDLSDNLVAIFIQSLSSLPLPAKLSNQCRSVCSARGDNLVKRKKCVEVHRFEIVLHFTNSHD